MRIAHWTLALLVVVNLFFNDTGGKPHRYLGYAAAAVVGLRLLYGLLGPDSAAALRWPSPGACLAHGRAMLRGQVTRSAGHNPLAAAMTLTLWLLVLLLGLTGWISRWDRYWGEDWPLEIHAALVLALEACVILHLCGVALSSLLEKQNLVKAMFSGNKWVDR